MDIVTNGLRYILLKTIFLKKLTIIQKIFASVFALHTFFELAKKASNQRYVTPCPQPT